MEKGLVVKSTGSWYEVRLSSQNAVVCRMRGKIRMNGLRLTNPVAVGDVVDVENKGDDYVIVSIHARKNYIIRKSVNLSKEAHIIAANVDLAVLVATVCHPEVSTIFIDRFLVIAEAYAIPVLLVFNKTDLCQKADAEKLKIWEKLYSNIGYTCLEMSCKTGEGTDRLKKALSGKQSVFSGMSGVGKSSIINRISPNIKQKIAGISDAHDSGKHTTTFAEMFFLDDGSAIIDTPGIRSLGMYDMKKEELSQYFPDIFKFSQNCRFKNCSHTHEPGCAVLESLSKGELAASRYASYLDIYDMDNEGKYR